MLKMGIVWPEILLDTSFTKIRMTETRKTNNNNPKTQEDSKLIVDKYSSSFESYQTMSNRTKDDNS